ncbi:MAG: ATP-binding protein [Epsilonproteobacteria bacterium]|nr:ATP-binding protein [Campylobacterota bacterium]
MNKIYFFNAANFGFAEIDLRKKNVFFVGDNGSGKTTAIRAIHYYYNSDVKALGIDPNKESFKDFYFKYDNSFLVYEFEDYFVLMYKRSGDIKRIFSKQKFDLNRVLKGDEIAPLKEVIEYANEAPLKYRPQTNEEYKKIIYGLDRQRLDFKLTTIKNYNTFINLYNKIFNVNRAVFDAKSIKETIFTTLDRVEAGEINYEEFANELMDYRQYFIFYRKFKQESANIEKLYIYKNALIELKKDIEEILGKIAYKKEIEEKLVDELINELKELETKKRKVLKQFGYFDKKIKNIEENIQNTIFELSSKLKEIEKLKEIFNLKAIQEAEKKVSQKEEIEKKLITLQTSLNELIKGIKNQVEEIEEEIERLKREKRILKDKLKEEEIREKRNLEEEFFEKFEKVKEEFIQKEKELLSKIEKIEKEITEKEDEKRAYQRELNEVNFKYSKKEDELKAEIQEEINKLKNKRRELQIKKDELLDEVVRLKRELKKLKGDYQEKVENIKKEYARKISLLEEKIIFYKNILKTKPNSFKEFLNQNVENWEEELYPVIDEKLLSMDIDELKPKVVSDRVFGIELDKSRLKSIPTMKEAEEEIEKLNINIDSLNKELQSTLSLLEKEFKAKEIEITSKIEINEEKAKEIDAEFKLIDEEIKNLNEKLKAKLNELNNLKNEEIKLIKININKKNDEIKALNEEINKIRRDIKALKRELQNKKEELEKEKIQKFKEIKEKLIEEFKQKEALIDEKINELNIKKNKISKDERVEELNREIQNIRNKLKEIEKAEMFLKEWEEKKEFINSENSLKQKLEKYQNYKVRINEFFLKMEKILNNKLAKIEEKIKNKDNELNIVKEGLKKVSGIKLPENKIKTNEYLSTLIDEYKLKDGEFKEKKIALKDTASDIKSALERFVVEGLEVNFNLEALGNLVAEELEKVDELYIFKDKKFDVLNKTRLKGLKNLISGILDKKLDNFEGAKEDFLKQVKRINNNLSKVDFGIIKGIRIEIEETKRNILKIFDEIKENIADLVTLLESEESLFFDRAESDRKLRKIEELFNIIKQEVKSESFTLIDVVDINVKFIENEKENTLKLIKNESSTGGSILLKIAIAVSLLELFIKEKASLFLILDEVSVLSTKNQKLLKDYVNERGLGVIYVTPDLPLVDVDEIDIYKFRNVGGEFEVVRLISEEGIHVS